MDDKHIMFFNLEQMNDLVAVGFPADNFIPVSMLPAPTSSKKISNGTLVKKAKEDITCYTFGRSYNVSWDSVTIEPTETMTFKYYIIKGKTWDINITLNGCNPIHSKDALRSLCNSLGIDINHVVLANDREAKKLKDRGVVDFITWFNKTHDFSWVDSTELDILNTYSTNRIDKIAKQQEFIDLASDNPIKLMVQKIITLLAKYKKIEGALGYLTKKSQGKRYTMPDETANFLLLQILNMWNDDDRKHFLKLANLIKN